MLDLDKIQELVLDFDNNPFKKYLENTLILRGFNTILFNSIL